MVEKAVACHFTIFEQVAQALLICTLSMTLFPLNDQSSRESNGSADYIHGFMRLPVTFW